jgi:hypothetical protein
MSDTRPWRARLLRSGGGVAGAGVLVDQWHVLTCAHVVNQALARDARERDPPGGEVRLDFVEADVAPLGARVVDGGWVPIEPDGRGDVAVLQLQAEVPRGTRPALLRRPPQLRGHRFDTYGYPRRYDPGVSASGVLAAWGGPANLWVELQGIELPGHRVEGGFSGAAVYDHDVQGVVGIVVAEDKLAEAKLAWMLPVRALVQLLQPSWPRLAAIARSGALYGPGELAGHWSPKARGVEREATRGWYFTGRATILRDLAAWVAGGPADGQVRVVTGRPGSGKSAVLARLVTLSDPLYVDRVPDLDSAEETRPPAGSIDVAVWARGKTIDDVVAAVAQATELDVDAPDALVNALLERAQPCTIVVDALDEAVEPAGIAGKLLRPLAADAAGTGVRVLVGTRPGREDELVDALGRGAVRFNLDQPPYLERADLVEFVRRRLLLAEDPTAVTPYRGQEELAGRVADAVADRAYPTFLVAQLTSRALVQAGEVVDVEAPGWRQGFPVTVADAMDAYLQRLAEAADSEQERRASRRRLRELLTPLAYAQGAGLPRGLWPAAATAMADRAYGPQEVEWLLDTAADYLVEQITADGAPAYRLYHEALGEYLRPTGSGSELALQGRLVRALLETVPERADGTGHDWLAAHPYLAAHLATHAAAARLLDELLVEPGFLVVADPARLLRALPAASSPAATEAARVYRLAVHQLRDRPVEERAAYLQLAARQQRADNLAIHIEQLGFALPWSTRWAAWQPMTAHHITGRHTGLVTTVAVGEVDGRTIAITGGDDHTVRIWDLRDGMPIGQPLTGHTDSVTAVAVGELDGQPIAVTGSDDHTVRIWDLTARAPLGRPLTGHTKPVTAVAVGDLDGQPIAVTGSYDRTVRVWNLPAGRARTIDIGARIQAIGYVPSSSFLVATSSGLVLLQL